MLVILKTLAVQRDRIRALGLNWNEDGELVLAIDVEGRMISVKEKVAYETVKLYGHAVGVMEGLDEEQRKALVEACAEDLSVPRG